MKRALSFAIIAFSLNAFAQSNLPHVKIQNSNLELMEKANDPILFGRSNLNEVNLIKHREQHIKQEKSQQNSIFQILDSTYVWYQSNNIVGLELTSKWVDFVYDSRNNLLRKTALRWYQNSWDTSGQYIYTYNVSNYITSETWREKRTGVWIDVSQITYTFDNNNNLTSETGQQWDGISCANTYKYIYTYDIFNNQTSFTDQIWDETYWLNVSRYEEIYNSNHDVIYELWQYWAETVWENSFQTILTYDNEDNAIHALYQNWDGTTWVNSEQSIFTYDGLTRIHIIQKWIDNAYVNLYQTILTRDSNNNILFRSFQTWNISSWENVYQHIYTYDEFNNQTSWMRQNWNGTMWENIHFFLLTFNGNNDVTSVVGQKWYENNWKKDSQSTYYFDVNFFMESSSSKRYDFMGNITSADSAYYYYHTVLGINDFPEYPPFLNVYPNPGSGKFIIESPSGIDNLEIFNLSGVRIYSCFKFNHQSFIEIDLSGYPKGVYLAKVKCGTRTYNSKVIIQ